jgi:Ser/Thr protein kinase RdoA (MazF antagonist)
MSTAEKPDERIARAILSQYGKLGSIIVPLKSGLGFSGADLWRVDAHDGLFCLRRWPSEHPTEERLQFIHCVLRHVYDHGVTEIAVPIANFDGKSTTCEADHLWELNPWMPGVADYHQSPSPIKLTAAMRLLARFHIATSSFGSLQITAPNGLVSRYQQLSRLLEGGFGDLKKVVRRTAWPDLFGIAQQILHLFSQVATRISHLLERSTTNPVPIQPCIRDIWHDHVLFTGDRVTGLIDFGALRNDHVASDLSRLMGSLVRDDAAGWEMAMAAYQELRPLSPIEQNLVHVYDQSAILLSAVNWLHWLYVEGRQFDNPQAVRQRLVEIVGRLANLSSRLERGGLV